MYLSYSYLKTSVLGIDSMVTWNAISCLLQLPHEAGYQRAVKLSAMIPEYDSWADQDLLCIRLQMALRGQEYDKAQQIISDFGNFFKIIFHVQCYAKTLFLKRKQETRVTIGIKSRKL